MTHLLTALLALSVGWCWGHRTARIRIIVIGATAQQDQAALNAENAAFIAETRRRFDEQIRGFDLKDPKDEAA